MRYCKQHKQFSVETQGELIEKTSLQSILVPKLEIFFKNIANSAHNLFVTHNLVISTSSFTDELQRILRNHYLLVSSRFSSNIREEKSFTKKQLNVDDVVVRNIAEHIEKRSQSQSAQILNTTQGDINKSFIEAESSLQDEGGNFTPEDIADLAIAEFLVLSNSRPEIIAETETQNSAESSKFIEAATISAAIFLARTDSATPINIPGEPTFPITGISEEQIEQQEEEPIGKKTWNTLFRNSRLDHIDADSQTVLINEPFRVGGELLNYAGDTELGATAKNIVGCNCSVTYSFD